MLYLRFQEVFHVAAPKAKADRKWRDEFYVLAYRLAREGQADSAIAKHLGVGTELFRRWKRERPAFAQALADGADAEKKAQEQKQILYNRLSPELQDVWDRICNVEEEARDDAEVRRDKRRARRLLDSEIRALNERLRQRLFVHAYLCCDYSMSEAACRTATPHESLRQWKKDPEFSLLLAEGKAAKKDFVESALMSLVRQGEPAAVIFANKTVNADRGYNDKLRISVGPEQAHGVEELGFTLEEQKLLLAKIREAQAKGLPAPEVSEEVPDAEFTVAQEVP